MGLLLAVDFDVAMLRQLVDGLRLKHALRRFGSGANARESTNASAASADHLALASATSCDVALDLLGP